MQNVFSSKIYLSQSNSDARLTNREKRKKEEEEEIQMLLLCMQFRYQISALERKASVKFCYRLPWKNGIKTLHAAY